MPRQRHIVALGGGGYAWEGGSALDHYILGLTSKRRPQVCYIGTASGDNERKMADFYQKFAHHHPECRLTHLPIFGQKGDAAEIVEQSDIFYVGGGSTTSMLVLWKAWGIDVLLRRAYERGKIMAGMSAGANCWFEQYVDDCSGRMEIYPGLGWLPGAFAPHYEERSEAWRSTLHKAIKAGASHGLGADNNVAIHFVDEVLTTIIAASPKVAAYKVTLKAGRVVETKLKVCR